VHSTIPDESKVLHFLKKIESLTSASRYFKANVLSSNRAKLNLFSTQILNNFENIQKFERKNFSKKKVKRGLGGRGFKVPTYMKEKKPYDVLTSTGMCR
jgi:hypothetical protein